MSKRPSKYRITRIPEYFIESKRGVGFLITTRRGKVVGTYETEQEARQAAINKAHNQWRSTPKEYIADHEVRLFALSRILA